MIRLDFNREWTLKTPDNTKAVTVNLPHDAMLHEPRKKDSLTGSAAAYYLPGRYIYRKELIVPAQWVGKTVILECEAVYQNSCISVNGERINERPNGYTNYFTNMSRCLRIGEENEICITADNAAAPNSRWYSGSGIYRKVWMYVGPQISIAPQGIRVTTIDTSHVRVDVELLEYGEPYYGNADFKIDIFDGDKRVACTFANHSVLEIPDAKLWDAENPNLYHCRVTISAAGEQGNTEDTDEVSFGIRMISCGAYGLRINGKEVLLRGGCIHHDNGPVGAACFADTEVRRIRILKEAGFNAIRSAHNPMSKDMLDACDKLGMYVMDELTDMWLIHKNPYDYGGEMFRDWWRKDLEAMIAKDYNHPSVIQYSIGNEISDFGQKRGQKLIQEMVALIKNTDPMRLTTAGINIFLASLVGREKPVVPTVRPENPPKTGKKSFSLDATPTSETFNKMTAWAGKWQVRYMSSERRDKLTDSITQYFDMPGFNYADGRYEREAKNHPDRAFTGTETYPMSLYNNWEMVKRIPNLTGDYMWTAWDYLGEVALGVFRYADKRTGKNVDPGLMVIAGCGVIDICGKMRPEVGWNKAIWGLSHKPVIGVDPLNHAMDKHSSFIWRDIDDVESWSWEGCEGRKTRVVVYTDADLVELRLNGECIGTRKVIECRTFFPDVVYHPGELKAITYNAYGEKLSESTLLTADGDTHIHLAADRKTLFANGQDLCFVEIDLVGSNGVTKSNVDQVLHVCVEGAGILQGLGSARPATEYEFTGTEYKTYYGKALAIIRAGYTPGSITITVSGNELSSKTMEIACISNDTCSAGLVGDL